MALKTSSSRRMAAAAGLILATAALSAAGRKAAPAFTPDAPEYRQKGPKNAPVVLTEFSDFQCPSCKTAAEPIKKVQAMFPEKIRVVYRHMPWDSHRFALFAAVASECAGLKGKFWEYHDKLFADQGTWGREDDVGEVTGLFLGYAEELGLGVSYFSACVKKKEIIADILAERKEAEDKYIRSTPTILINGKRFVGARQLTTFGVNYIENILKEKGEL